MTYLRLLESSFLKNLLDDILIDRGAEFVLQRRLGGAIVRALGAVPARGQDFVPSLVAITKICCTVCESLENSLVRAKDLER